MWNKINWKKEEEKNEPNTNTVTSITMDMKVKYFIHTKIQKTMNVWTGHRWPYFPNNIFLNSSKCEIAIETVIIHFPLQWICEWKANINVMLLLYSWTSFYWYLFRLITKIVLFPFRKANKKIIIFLLNPQTKK